MSEEFDPTSDFRTDAGEGNDPDSFSPMLKEYHKLLWSKPLPGGEPFDLDDSKPGAYLHHQSPRGEFYLTSDTAMRSFLNYERMAEINARVSESEWVEFDTVTYQMGGMMLFPGRQIHRRWTINQARGMNSRIADRLDLTVECIRQHYMGGSSPLAEVLSRYEDFFDLFEDFQGYVDFFLLQDLVSDDLSLVRFFMPLGESAYPSTLDTYQGYRESAIAFVQARNHRMFEYADLQSHCALSQHQC
jgi:hypothetical protein